MLLVQSSVDPAQKDLDQGIGGERPHVRCGVDYVPHIVIFCEVVIELLEKPLRSS